MRSAIISSILSFGLVLATACVDSGTTSVDIGAEAKPITSRGPGTSAKRGPSRATEEQARGEAPRVTEAEAEGDREEAETTEECPAFRA